VSNAQVPAAPYFPRVPLFPAFFLLLFLLCPVSSFAQSPSVTGFSPVSAAGVGFQLFVGGSGFGSSQGSSTITFNGVPATVGYWSDSQIIAVVPAGATTGSVVVTVGGFASNGLIFTVTTAPLLTGFSPGASGGVGTEIYVGGSNLGATQGSSTVTFNGVAATAGYWSNDILIATVPPGATTGPVVVTVGGVASNGLTFTVVSTPQISGLSPVSAAGVGFQLYIGGSNFGATQGSSTVTFNGVTPTVQYWSNTQIQAVVPAGATTGPIVVTVGGIASNGFTFTVTTTPLLTSFDPGPSGSPGSQVFVGGSNFGAAQGSSTITFNGVAASVGLWTDSELTMNVPTSATSGNVVVTVGGVASNPLNFTVVVPPTITALASPAPNANGWNNSSVTVKFTCTAASGGLPIATCPSPQTVSTEGQNQVITETVTDTGGNQASASVTLNIDKTIPSLAITSPTDQSTAADSTVTVSGTVSDSLSGDSGVTCNGTAAPLSGGSFSCNISLNVGVNLIMVRATDVAGNVAGSNFHVVLPGTLPVPNSLSVTPTGVNMLVNGTQQFTAVDDQGRPRSDATWTVSDTTLATIDTDASPTLTAVAVGQITLTAAVGSVNARTVVNILSGTSLPLGTVLWTLPITSGSSPAQIVQAAPVTGGPDVYSFDGANVTAATASGQQMWRVSVPNAFTKSPFQSQPTLVGDGNGGILVPISTRFSEATGIVDLDGQTGTKIWEYDAPSDQQLGGTLAVGPDGTVYFPLVIASGESTAIASIQAVDGTTGASAQLYALPPSTISANSAPCSPTIIVSPISQGSSTFNIATASSPIVGPDGSVYFEITNENDVITEACGGNTSTESNTRTISLVQISPSRSPNVTRLQQVTTTGEWLSSVSPRPVIPDGQGGVLASWTLDNLVTGQGVAHATDVSSNGTNDYQIPIVPAEMVLGDNGNAFATDQGTVVAFNVADGTTVWTYASQSTNGPLDLVAATSGGGLSINDGNAGVVTFDASGNPTASGITSSFPSPWSLGNWFGAVGDPVLARFTGPLLALADSDYPFLNGDAEGQSASKFEIAIVWCVNTLCANVSTLTPDVDIPFTYFQDNPLAQPNPPTVRLTPAQIMTIKRNGLNALQLAFSAYNVTVGEGHFSAHTLLVVGEDSGTGDCGNTNPFSAQLSRVFYPEAMEEPQFALNIQTSQPSEVIVESIGEGIGNNGAHEIAHQLVTRYITSGKIVGGMGLDDNSIVTYNGKGCSGLDQPWNYTGISADGKTGIHWGADAVTSLTNIYGLKKPKQ
jgi:Glucodextranase, domain B/IPT/TIG domain/PQQ-like domain